jgi:antitoxin (DNA-binding transcriptional repressor) of toxin-antitoxin stability system
MHRISASELARRLGDILGRVRYRGEAFLIERHDVAIARLGPVPGATRSTLRDAGLAWTSAPADSSFADDLERAGRADRPPRNPWDS